MSSYNSLESLTVHDNYEFENDRIHEKIREKIASLSKIYRDIIILYYYDSLTVKQIAQKLGIAEGTVTWRLSEGRNKLKKECTDMTETALRPVDMNISISGSGNYNGTTIPYPDEFIKDALSQNIFYHCYEKAKSVEELSKLCGVPAYYIESNIKNLLKREALSEPTKGKYQTNFIIYNNKVDEYIKTGEKFYVPLLDNFIEILKSFSDDVSGMGIYTADRGKNELLYLYGLLAFNKLRKHNPIPFIEWPVRYDGNRWNYIAHLKNENILKGIGLGMRYKDTGDYSYISFYFGNFEYNRFIDENIISVCGKRMTGAPVDDTESAAKAIEQGFIKRNENGELVVTIPWFTKKQKDLFDEKAEKYFAPFIDDYVKAITAYADGYKKQFPKHLEDEVIRACNNIFMTLFTNMTRMAQEKGLLDLPEPGSYCDVLIQYK